MGFRVTQSQKKKRFSPSQNGDSLLFKNLLSTFADFLRYIGTPFYHILTWIIVLTFKLTWGLGELVISIANTFLSLISSGANYISSVKDELENTYQSYKKLLIKKTRILTKQKTKSAYAFKKKLVKRQEFKLPTLPKLTLLSLPEIHFTLPQIPEVKLLKLKLPKRKIKKVSFPKFVLPQIKFTIPHIKFILPKINLPKTPRIKVKKPKVSKPEISMPQFVFAVPHLRLPRLPSLVKKFLIILLPALIISIGFWIMLLKDLPKPGVLATRDQVVSTKIYDRNGNLLFKIYRDENRTLVPLTGIPEHVQQATIAIEDADFYSHPGFSIRGITRAFYKNYTQGELTGGSTITQQLIKNTLLTSEKTLSRKIKEVILSIQTELTFSKDQILEMYFNEVCYGGASCGIEEASQLYFNKHVQELSLAEAALLAGLPKAPTSYSPFGAYPEAAKLRQEEVLNKMAEEGYITQKQAEEAAKQELEFAQQETDIKAPHFVMHIKQLLAERYGERIVEEGGLEVITTLDLEIQEMAEKVVAEETEKIKRMNINNGAVLITDPKNGAILAMVGSKNYFDQKGEGNYNVTTALRQPGSSIKPINYSYAIDNGTYTAASLIPDTPITYKIAGSEPYTPHNYDNKFRGNVTLRTALGSSLNIPAVRVLASYGVPNMITHAQKMGITTWNDPKRFGLSLTLGGGEVMMTDMNVAYGVFANYGQKVPLNPILKVTNYRGQTLEEEGCKLEDQPQNFVNILFPKAQASEFALKTNCSTQALDPRTAFIMTNILTDNSARTPVFGPRSLLVIPNHPEVAVKTGTTQNLRDNWAIGFTQDYVVSAWVGNNDNTPMGYVASGVTGATPIWHKVMANLIANTPSTPWLEPAGLIKVNICPQTGTLPCQGCQGKPEYFLPGTQPKKQCVVKTEEQKQKEEEEKKKLNQTAHAF